MLKRFWEALKDEGILYSSFKHGKNMRIDKDRVFNDYEENALDNFKIKEQDFLSFENAKVLLLRFLIYRK